MTIHICRCGHPHDPESLAQIARALGRLTNHIDAQGDNIVGALENLQAANLAEEGQLEQFLTDIAGKLDGHDDPAIQAVADSITARVAKMAAADPGPADTDPGDPGTPPVDEPPVDEPAADTDPAVDAE